MLFRSRLFAEYEGMSSEDAEREAAAALASAKRAAEKGADTRQGSDGFLPIWLQKKFGPAADTCLSKLGVHGDVYECVNEVGKNAKDLEKCLNKKNALDQVKRCTDAVQLMGYAGCGQQKLMKCMLNI